MEPKTKHEISEVSWQEKVFLTKRAKLPFDKLSDFFNRSYGELYSALGKTGIQAAGMPCAFYYSIDEINKETEFAVAVPVPVDTPDIQGFGKIILPPSRLVTTTHIGSYETMGPAYAALEGYVDGKHLKKGLVIEEYFSDPEVEKDPATWKTNIYFQLK